MKILYTTALINNYYEERKKEYLMSYNKLLEKFNNNDIYIIECVSNEKNTYLNQLNNVFYTNTHDNNLKNKGVKEVLGLKKFIENNYIDDNEFIIKLTGRYLFINFDIFNIVSNNYDCYVKKDDYNQIFFGCFICKFKIFKDFLFNINLEFLEKNMINIEKEFADYINNNKINYFGLNKLNIYSKINNTDIVYW